MLLYPLCLAKNYGSLKYFLLVGICSFFYILVLFYIEMLTFHKLNESTYNIEWTDFSWKLLPAFGVFVVSYSI